LEVRVALAFATGRDTSPETSLRGYLQPVRWEGKWWAWSDRPAVAPTGAGIGRALAEVARRRGFPGAVPDPLMEEQPGMRGSRIAWRHGLILSLADRQALVHGTVDGQRLAALIAGLLCVKWPAYDRAHLPSSEAAPDPAVDLLLPFSTAEAEPLLVRPGSAWPALLAAGRIGDVLDDARRRLVVAGCGFVVEPAAPDLDPYLTAASLLLAGSASQRVAARDRVTRTEEDIPA
jgi:CRISPR-associated protein Csx17